MIKTMYWPFSLGKFCVFAWISGMLLGACSSSSGSSHASSPAPGTSSDTPSATVANAGTPPVGAGVPPQPAVAAPCYQADPAICDMEYKIFLLTNQYRRAQGIAPLTYSARIAFVARSWTKQEAGVSQISHNGFPAARQAQYYQEFKRSFVATNENTAMNNYGVADLAAGFMTQWLNSPGHLANIRTAQGNLGVGVAQDAAGAWYSTQLFGRE